MSRRASRLGLSLLLGFAGCAGFDNPDSPVGEVARAEAPRLAPFACGDGAPPALRGVAEFAGQPLALTMSPCGALAWIEPDGRARVLRRGADSALELSAPDETSTLAEVRLDRRGERAWVRVETSWTLRSLDGAAPVALPLDEDSRDAVNVGFARAAGDRELPWACTAEGLWVIADGAPRLLSRGAERCDRALVAAEAPVVVHVDGEWGLRAVDLERGAVVALPEVAFVSVLDDPLRLSRDGRILYHQPGEDPSLRAGVFDLEAEEGERLIGAVAILGGLSGVIEASQSGHAAVMISQEGETVSLFDGVLRLVEGGQLVGVSPLGDEVLLSRPSLVRGGAPTLLAHAVETQEEESFGVLAGAGAASAGLRSYDGNALALAVSDSRGRPAVVRWRWDRRALLPTLPGRGSPLWVSERGAVLDGNQWGQSRLFSDDGREVAQFDDYLTLRREVSRERLLVWTPGFRGTGEQGLHLVYSTHPNRQALVRTEALSQVLLDGAAETLAYVVSEPDPDDPTLVRSTITAGAIP